MASAANEITKNIESEKPQCQSCGITFSFLKTPICGSCAHQDEHGKFATCIIATMVTIQCSRLTRNWFDTLVSLQHHPLDYFSAQQYVSSARDIMQSATALQPEAAHLRLSQPPSRPQNVQLMKAAEIKVKTAALRNQSRAETVKVEGMLWVFPVGGGGAKKVSTEFYHAIAAHPVSLKGTDRTAHKAIFR